MKIALVLDDSLDRPDGVQQYVLATGAYLTRAGHEVHYVCSEAGRTDLPHLHSLARNVGVSFNGNGLRMPLAPPRRDLRAFLERERFDVIHVQLPHSPLFSARLVREARRLRGQSVSIVGTFLILPTGRAAAAATRVLGAALVRNLRLFDRFCALTPPARDFAKRAFRIDASVIPSGVDLRGLRRAGAAAARARSGRDRLVVTFLGRLVPRKGSTELIEALARLSPESRGRIRVRIGGRGPLAARLADDVARLGLADLVTLEGFVSEADKPAFLADADIAVFPATGGESFGIVLAEAMASGAGVVVGGDNPGYASVLGGDRRVLVDPGDAGRFSAVLDALIGDADLRERISADQRVLVEQFDIEVVGPALERLYRGE